MRTLALACVWLVAVTSAAALHQERRAVPTPKAHMMRRVVGNASVYPRAPRPAPQGFFPGIFGDSGDDSSDSSTGTGSSSSSGSDSTKTSASDTSSTDDATSSQSKTSSTPSSSSKSSSSDSSSSSESEPTQTSFGTTATVTSSSSQAASATGTAGSVTEITSTVAAPVSTSDAAAAASATTSAASSDDSGSSHTGLIVGVSVVGGLALLGALIFLYMKFGGKRFSDYQDDDADIKWPELKHDDNAAAMQPLPARRTGGAGFDMGDDSDVGHGAVVDDAHSMTEYGNKGHDAMAASTTAFNAAPMEHASYGYDDGTGYGPPAGSHQEGVTGYYDPYGQYGADHDQGNQIFFPEQQQQQHAAYGGPPSYGAGSSGSYGGEYGGDAGYNSHSASTSPAVQPHRVGGYNMHQHY